MEQAILENTVLLNEGQVAEWLRISVPTLRRWRTIQQGPPFLKLGGLVKYLTSDIEEWLDKSKRG